MTASRTTVELTRLRHGLPPGQGDQLTSPDSDQRLRTTRHRLVCRPTAGRTIRVLVVDGDSSVRELLSTALDYFHWEAITAHDGVTAIRTAEGHPPDAVILSTMLPDMSGLAVLDQLRQVEPKMPIVVLSSDDSPQARIAGLAAGGDDCVTKPFSIEELTLRLRAVLRRCGIVTEPGSVKIVVGDLVLDEESWEVSRGGIPIDVTAKEFELLRFLMRNPRRALSKRELLRRVWHDDSSGRDNIVELYVSYLRKKIDDGRSPMIHTVRGVGYVLKAGA